MTVLPLFGADEAPHPSPPADDSDAAPTAAPPATQSLYRKYRPQSFDEHDLVGQEHIVRTLRNAIRLGRVAHAYLFCGPRGTGKTTTARLLAKAVNCLDPDPDRRPCNACAACRAIAAGTATDIIEIDAASNRGIEDIRDLRERVKYAPAQLATKFYIVDEAHQITGAAANAFLKTLEEPPAHTKFVLATTDPEELLPTIVSRCQRFDFRRIGQDAMAGRLRTVAGAEGIPVADDALAEIARHATGSLRDALGLLDQLALHAGDADASGEAPAVTADDVRALLGISRNDRVEALLRALADRDVAAGLAAVNAAVDAGEDPRQLNRQLVAALRALLHDRAAGRAPGDPGRAALADRLDLARLAELLRAFGDVDYRIRHSPYAHLPLELALVEASLEPAAAPPAGAPPAAEARSAPPPAPEEAALDPGRPTSRLRDRVRSTSSAPRPAAAPPRSLAEDGPPPAPVAPPVAPPSAAASPRGNGSVAPAQAVPASGDGILSVDQLADLWPRIRQDVKALNRRAEALLANADPARAAGNRITLTTPYEFHRDKLNSAEIRDLVQTVIGRLAGGAVVVETRLPSELGAAPAPAAPQPAAPSAAPPPAAPQPAPVAPVAAAEPRPALDDEAHDQRLRSALNIFDGEVIGEE